jgi:predicted esterase
MMGGAKAHYDGIVAFSQTDFTDDLKKITVPVLVMHGDDDQIVPYADAGPLSEGKGLRFHGVPEEVNGEEDGHHCRPAPSSRSRPSSAASRNAGVWRKSRRLIMGG